MYLFSKDYFMKTLKQLTIAEEQIRSVGMYIKVFKKEYKNILDVFTVIFNESSVHHKLVLLYLLNEILQTDKNYDKDSLHLKTELKKFIINNFAKAKSEAAQYPSIYKKLKDLERVWEQRNVVDVNQEFNIETFFADVDACNGNKNQIIDTLRKYLDKLANHYDTNVQ